MVNTPTPEPNLEAAPSITTHSVIMRIRKNLASMLLVVASLLVTMGILELVLRAINFEPLRDLARGKDLVLRVSQHPDIGYELVPGSRGRAFKTDVVVNRAGFRGPDLRTEPGLRRVVSIGDSIAFGSELPAGTAYSELLRELLAAQDPRFELINLALSGYDTLQEVATLERHGIAHDPEFVVLGFCLNDAGLASANAEYLQRLESYRTSFWIANSRLAQLLASNLDRLLGRRFEREQNRDSVFRATYEGRIDALGSEELELASWMAAASSRYPSSWYRKPDRVGRIRHAFARLGKLATREHFQVLVVVFPWLETDAGEYPHTEAHRIVAYEAARQGFGLLDLQHAFRTAGLNLLRNDPDDPIHPSPEGHRIAAREISNWLDSAEWTQTGTR
jgi:lysophospholipase L1-like esterase